MQLQTAKKGSMLMTAYFSKMKHLADSLAIVGKPVEHNDLITYILTGLDSQDYESLVTTLLAKGENMSLDELYAVLLSHEMRLDQKKGKLSDDVMHNLTTNVAQKNQGFYKGNFGYQRGIGGLGGNTQNNFGNGSNGGNNMPFKPNIVVRSALFQVMVQPSAKTGIILLLFLKEVLEEEILDLCLINMAEDLIKIMLVKGLLIILEKVVMVRSLVIVPSRKDLAIKVIKVILFIQSQYNQIMLLEYLLVHFTQVLAILLLSTAIME